MRPTHLPMLRLAAHAIVAAPAALAQTGPLPGDAPSVKAGDTWRWARNDRRTGLKEGENTRTIKAWAADRIEADESDGPAVYTKDMHVIETAHWSRTPPPPFYAWPLAVGKKWDFKYAKANKTGNLSKSLWQYSAEVVGKEKIKVAAGEFEAGTTYNVTELVELKLRP